LATGPQIVDLPQIKIFGLTRPTSLPSKQEMFWAKKVAREAIAQAEKTSHALVTVRAGASPSGPKHIGNMNDQVRAHFIRMSIDALNRKSRFVLTTDDMDPLRSIPARIPNCAGDWQELGEEAKRSLRSELGKPVSSVHDPFDCHISYSEHFTSLMMADLYALEVRPELFHVSRMYREGLYYDFMFETMSKVKQIREVLRKFQTRIPADWVPLTPVCANCGKLNAKVLSIDLESRQVEYECVTRTLHGKYEVKGCGYRAHGDMRNAKLPWRFEWVADWKIFLTDAEPFGKDHYEGSWKSGRVLAKEIYGFEPPVPLVYEFFLVDGEKMASRLGNVYTISDMLKLVEPEVVRYMYVKKPLVQRDIAVKNVDRLVLEFDEIERLAFEEKGERADEAKIYYSYCGNLEAEKPPIRIPYQLAASMVQFYQPRVALERLVMGGLVSPSLTDQEKASAIKRLVLASNWVRMFPERRTKPIEDGEILEESPQVVKAFAKLRDEYSREEPEGERLQALLYKVAKEYGIAPSEFFKVGYRLFLGSESGPRLGNFLATLDKDVVFRKLGQVKERKANH